MIQKWYMCDIFYIKYDNNFVLNHNKERMKIGILDGDVFFLHGISPPLITFTKIHIWTLPHTFPSLLSIPPLVSHLFTHSPISTHYYFSLFNYMLSYFWHTPYILNYHPTFQLKTIHQLFFKPSYPLYILCHFLLVFVCSIEYYAYIDSFHFGFMRSCLCLYSMCFLKFKYNIYVLVISRLSRFFYLFFFQIWFLYIDHMLVANFIWWCTPNYQFSPTKELLSFHSNNLN